MLRAKCFGNIQLINNSDKGNGKASKTYWLLNKLLYVTQLIIAQMVKMKAFCVSKTRKCRERMKRIVIIGANYFQNPLIEKAKALGYETHVFAWKEGAVGEKTADFFYPISIIEKERILEECVKIQPDAVVSIASDLANITVQYLAKKLGLPCNSDESILISTNKYAMRDALKKSGINSGIF